VDLVRKVLARALKAELLTLATPLAQQLGRNHLGNKQFP
jgi:hypothetical protein